MTEANEMAKKIKEAHNHNQRDIDEIETEAREMTSKKVTTQKLHKVLQDAGYRSSFYKPSQRASRNGYSIHVSKWFYGITPNITVGQTAELLAKALNDAGIDTEFVKDMLKVQKFQ